MTRFRRGGRVRLCRPLPSSLFPLPLIFVVAFACREAFTTDVAVVARAGDSELTVDRLSEVFAQGKALAMQRNVIERVARLWVDYSLFAQKGAAFDFTYHCPIKPLIEDRTTMEHIDRKPGPGLLLRAARELAIDLHRSWMVGDSASDVLAGRNAGCRGSILVATGEGASDEDRERFDFAGFHEAADLTAAAELITASA